MKKTLVTTAAALVLAAFSVGAAIAPAAAATTVTKTLTKPAVTKVVVVKHPAHWHMHRVCKTSWRHHHKVTVCSWVKNR